MNKKSEKQANDLRAKAVAASEAHTKSALALAETLFEIYYGGVVVGREEIPLYQAWKYDTFHDYVESELGMHGSTARRYVHVHDTLVLGAGVEQERLPKSITKLMQLSRIAQSPGRSVKGWLKRANELTCCDFEAAVDEELGTKGPHKNFSFYMKFSQIASLHRQLKRAKEVLGTATNGETLTEVFTQWSDLQSSTTKLRKVG